MSMFEEIVGSSPALQAVLSRVARVAPADSTVLIMGETGTGKELVARAIHKRSQRFGRAFVSVNCAAVPPSLIASELFGHEKGAFTGAQQRRLGRFELAEGGTIFLDEIGDLPVAAQIALLRVLQEREFERVGGSHPISTDVRVIAATNRNLHAAIAAGTFRLDLFYRLSVFPIGLPPLRERKEDIPMLLEYFTKRYAGRLGKNIKHVDKRTVELFQSYDWPGNVRELQNVIERSVILCDSEVLAVDDSWLSIVRWTTNNPGGTDVHFAVVQYGTDPEDLSQIAKSQIRLNRGHPETIFRVRMSGLKPRTTYYYKVTSTESTGKSDGVESPVNRFTTPGPGDRTVAYPPQPDQQPR